MAERRKLGRERVADIQTALASLNSNVYSAVNAVVGHYNNFGTKAPIPKKRAERIVKELKDAELALSRGR